MFLCMHVLVHMTPLPQTWLRGGIILECSSLRMADNQLENLTGGGVVVRRGRKGMVPKDGGYDTAHYAVPHMPRFLAPQLLLEGRQAILWMRNLGIKEFMPLSPGYTVSKL